MQTVLDFFYRYYILEKLKAGDYTIILLFLIQISVYYFLWTLLLYRNVWFWFLTIIGRVKLKKSDLRTRREDIE